jgi:hypothetical protein
LKSLHTVETVHDSTETLIRALAYEACEEHETNHFDEWGSVTYWILESFIIFQVWDGKKSKFSAYSRDDGFELIDELPVSMYTLNGE